VAGCATPTGFAGHAPASAATNSQLTFYPDHSMGANHFTVSAAQNSAMANRDDRHACSKIFVYVDILDRSRSCVPGRCDTHVYIYGPGAQGWERQPSRSLDIGNLRNPNVAVWVRSNDKGPNRARWRAAATTLSLRRYLLWPRLSACGLGAACPLFDEQSGWREGSLSAVSAGRTSIWRRGRPNPPVTGKAARCPP
jgi:hypothetical protein